MTDEVEPRIYTVSTVKDNLSNVRDLVGRNLRSGVDHMFIFLDAPQEAVHDWLRGQEHVTVVLTDASYWTPKRPTVLNVRQRVNANLVNCLLASIGARGWLFHIDGDECLEIERDWLERLDETVPYVKLASTEAVSTEVRLAGEPYFKRLLPFDDLALLAALGAIDQPSNERYFNGHTMGKPGIRPSLAMELHIHHGRIAGVDKRPEPVERADLRVLHYESFSAEEFVRKWTNHIGAGVPPRRFREERRRLRGAIASVNGNPHIDTERKRELLLQVYRRWVQDDIDVLLELGLVERPDARLHAYEARPLEPGLRASLDQLLDRLVRLDKETFNPAKEASFVAALPRLEEELRGVAPQLAEQLRQRRQQAAVHKAARRPKKSGASVRRSGGSLVHAARRRLTGGSPKAR